MPLAFDFLDHEEGQLHDLVEDVFPEVARMHDAMLFDLAGAMGGLDEEEEGEEEEAAAGDGDAGWERQKTR